MVLSMTGYGRAEEVRNGRDIAVELRSVNSRYFEYSCRVPRTCAFLEDPLKRLVAEQVHRGKVELSLSIRMFRLRTRWSRSTGGWPRATAGRCPAWPSGWTSAMTSP